MLHVDPDLIARRVQAEAEGWLGATASTSPSDSSATKELMRSGSTGPPPSIGACPPSAFDKSREAEVVRRAWLVDFPSRKVLPKKTMTVIVQGLAVNHGIVGKAVQGGNILAHTLLGVKRDNYWTGDKLGALVSTTGE